MSGALVVNRYPLWKNLLIISALLVAGFFAMPNIYGEDPAIQVLASRGSTIDGKLEDELHSALQAAGITPKRIQRGADRLLVRFPDTEVQLRAQDIVRSALGNDYVVALNLAPAAPGWLTDFGALPMYLGLDLRGGVHFLMEVDVNAAVRQAEERYVGELKSMFRKEKLRYRTVMRDASELESQAIKVSFHNPAPRDRAYELIRKEFQDFDVRQQDANRDAKTEFQLILTLTETAIRDLKHFALQQNITTLRNRVNELGVAEPLIQQQGENRIVVQLPGVQDTARAKDILGATATLEFRAVYEGDAQAARDSGRVPLGARLYPRRQGGYILLKRQVIITGEHITNAASGIDQESGSPDVSIALDGYGGNIMDAHTKENIGKRMAVVFIENKVETHRVDGENVRKRRTIVEVINAAVIQGRFGSRFHITGLDSTEEARNLALLLRAGALAAPIEIVEERTVGPSLGKENIAMGFRSVVIGFVLVLVFMAIYYRVFGIVADIALAVNLVMIVGVLSMLQATLTLPGIAGIVLTTGMAVDANVLIFERIREEIRNGNTPQASIYAGYEKAFSTITDANITTLIAAIVLFGFGTGPIKGFAITLSIGIVTSLFTAILGTRAIINLVYGGRRVAKLHV
uniref:Protein translocase subunit SecD n=1 Tax=Candidatus Kentrum sp. FM TaxID=2126340 RepID=A0A450S1F1_9GAMM|nr:MAG: preprotein translocase subunit SecD [Candidatus Kentron sp. FM]VFJ45478.1 MAG: preprotein translocase subunit SecD [Candidatus Kentron sp. FM]VFK06641.1 MAG: preprotein translocase subunit SecD [Candidatus Kentron sp. FM]